MARVIASSALSCNFLGASHALYKIGLLRTNEFAVAERLVEMDSPQTEGNAKSRFAMKLLEAELYQAAVEIAFRAVARELQGLLPLARIEHVGASSIPGAVSKGDLDVCVIVSAADHAATVEILEGAGYAIKVDTFRAAGLCMLVSPRSELDLALQVVAAGSEFEFFLRFRDALRASPGLVEQYNQIKRETATLGHERYRDAKARFIRAVVGLRG